MSAGSLNSAQLLMLSGIGPKWHLDQLGKFEKKYYLEKWKVVFKASNLDRKTQIMKKQEKIDNPEIFKSTF